ACFWPFPPSFPLGHLSSSGTNEKRKNLTGFMVLSEAASRPGSMQPVRRWAASDFWSLRCWRGFYCRVGPCGRPSLWPPPVGELLPQLRGFCASESYEAVHDVPPFLGITQLEDYGRR